MDEKLKVVLYFIVKNDQENLSKTDQSSWHLIPLPEDYRVPFVDDLTEAVDYLDSLGYDVKISTATKNAWHGWDIALPRAEEGFPAEFLTGRTRFNYQIMPENIKQNSRILFKNRG